MNSQERKTLKKLSMINLLWLLIALLALAGATYAWFNFSNTTNINPNEGSIGEGEENLLIANTRDGEFGTNCSLLLQSNGGDLRPVSTTDLKHFYSAIGQDKNGISILYEETTSKLNSWTIHGELFLKVKGGKKSVDVYLFKDKLDFGSNAQAIASMRLGLKADDGDPVILKLDDMMDTSKASERQTTPERNTLVSSITAGSANYVPDTSGSIDDYVAEAKSKDDKAPNAGAKKICTVTNDKITKIEYYLYLEGCDLNTINDVQNKDVKLKLSFAGIPSKN